MMKLCVFKFFILFALLFSITSFAADQTAAMTQAKGAEIGKVIIFSGENVKAIEPSKNVRMLTKRGALVHQGDTIITGADSRVQIRFVDDTSISLRPDSEFRIDDYKFNTQDPSQNKNFGTLVKGGFRTLTGAISKNDPAKYQLTTPVAVIGVRGTDYTAVLKAFTDNKGEKGKMELYTTVWSGKTTVTNDAGQLLIGAGEKYQNAMVTSSKSLPEGLLQPPDIITQCPNRHF